MEAPNTQVFIEQQTRQYQLHLNHTKRAQQILQFQENIKTHKTIPKQYQPPTSLETVHDNPTAEITFNKQYRYIFFKHLDDTILQNTIALELESARLRETILHTEQHLAQLNLPSLTLKKIHQDFLKANNIIHHESSPQLKRLLSPTDDSNPQETLSQQQHLSPSTTNNRARKRKRCRHHRSRSRNIKPCQAKQHHHFLFKRPAKRTPPI